MHASIEQLLTLRDGELAAVDAAEHVAQCQTCARRLEQLRLRREQLDSLPSFEPPRHAWQNIERALKPARKSWPLTVVRAAAAGIVIGMIAVGVTTYLHQENLEDPVNVAAANTPPMDEAQLASLVGRSRELEDELRALPERPSVQRVSTAAAIDTLQARIEWVDEQLSSAPETIRDATQARQLWRERVDLMDSLLKVRDAEASTYAF